MKFQEALVRSFLNFGILHSIVYRLAVMMKLGEPHLRIVWNMTVMKKLNKEFSSKVIYELELWMLKPN
jgi:hypothetical protein